MGAAVGPPAYLSGIVAPGVTAGHFCCAPATEAAHVSATVAAMAPRARNRSVTGVTALVRGEWCVVRQLFDRSTFSSLRDAVGHPLRRRRALEVVVEELLHALLEVLLIFLARKMVRLARIGEQDDLFSPTAR